MSAAILGGVETSSIRTRRRPSARTEAFVAPPEARSVRFRRVAKRSLIWTAGISAVLFVIGIVASILFYNYYAQIVERRVNAGFWQTRAGLYAAPYQIRKDQEASPETLVELLRRSGYVEGTADGNVWNGYFERAGNQLEITSSNSYNLEPEVTTIKFAGNKINDIRHNGVLEDNYQIEPEMLSGRSETKRAKNHVLKFEEIPENLRRAIVAAEDQRFFEHHGLDPRGIGRALVANLGGREIKQGGSTITQQLVKNTFLTPERSFTRKFAEAFLSIALENKMSKQDIFAIYCNEIYLGQYGGSGVHGVEQAARAYFGKELNDLSLSEAATVAAMIKNPRSFSPVKNPENSKMRRDWILGRMRDLNLASDVDVEIARNADPKLAQPKASERAIAPYFVDAAMREITEKFEGDYLNSNFNMRVYTTIDTQMQTIAERAVAKHLEGLDKYFAKKGQRLQASIVALDPRTGHVLAMVGGRDYRESQFNRATDALRSPGSTFKPIVYATAYERGMTPITVAPDRPTEFFIAGGKTYEPANYHDSYTMNNITLKSALVKSSNVVAVKTAMDVGLASVAQTARQFGFENVQTWPSMALGTAEVTPLQLAAAYAVFANGGSSVQPTFIDKVISGSDAALHISDPKSRPVIKEQTAYMVTDALMDVVKRGTAAKANGALGKSVVFAGKTGTTKDGWFVGYTPNLVTVAWVGLDDNEDLHATGGDIALPLWVDFMRDVVQLRPEYGGSRFAMPKGLTEVVIDPETGMAASDYCPQHETAVVPTSAATFVNCFKHEPLQTMYAMSDVHDSAPYETTIEAVGTENRPAVERNSRTIVEYEDYSEDQDQLNIRRPSSPAGVESARPQTTRHVGNTDLDASDHSLKSPVEKIKKPK